MFDNDCTDYFLPSFCYSGNARDKTEKFVPKVSLSSHKSSCVTCSVVKSKLDINDMQEKILAHEQVKKSGKCNFEGCQIKVNTKVNEDYLRQMLGHFEYKDTQVVDLLVYGFPIGFKGDEANCPPLKPIWQYRNYKGAEEYPEQMVSYLSK